MRAIDELIEVYPALSPLVDAITKASAMIVESVNAGGKVLTCGNGGSASDSEHIVGELMKGFLNSRPLTAEETTSFEDAFPGLGQTMASKLQRGIPAVSLVSQTAIMTATLNDQDPNMVFAQQVFALGQTDDVLIAISTSGNSENVLMAARTAKARGLHVIGLTGGAGGQLQDLCDLCLVVPADRVDRIQEMHLPVYHTLCASVEAVLFGGESLDGGTITAPAKPRPPLLPKRIIFDFDGVFTDNKVYTAQDGTETVLCDRRDSLGLNMLKARGIEMFILSLETNPVVQARAAKLDIPVKGGCENKGAFLTQYFKDEGIDPADVIYMGNDLNDLEAMQMVGFAVAPSDAHPQILAVTDLVVAEPGGHGAVRALCEYLLKQMEG